MYVIEMEYSPTAELWIIEPYIDVAICPYAAIVDCAHCKQSGKNCPTKWKTRKLGIANSFHFENGKLYPAFWGYDGDDVFEPNIDCWDSEEKAILAAEAKMNINNQEIMKPSE